MIRPTLPFPWLPVLAIAALGLALRIAAALGGLWLDEAWSAAFAADVGTPLGVFLNVHHDNNHHLNTLWLQLVGIDASPIVQRGLSIASGTVAIVVAAAIVAPRGRLASVIAAAAFAMSPIMVTYGSEARGYAPMLLAILAVVLIVGRWLDAPRHSLPVIGISLLCLLGTLSQMTMIFGICAIVGWVALRRWKASDVRTAMRDTVRAMALPFVVTIASIGAIVRWLPGAGGFKIGSWFPFTGADLLLGQRDMVAFTLGVPVGNGATAAILLVTLAGLACLPGFRDRGAFYVFAIVGVPLGCAVAHLGNVAIPRYFLIGSAAVLLLLSEAAASAITRGGIWRYAAMATMAVLLAGSTARTIAFLSDLRADPAQAIAAMARRAPDGATVTLDRPRAAPVIRAAAASAGYVASISRCGRFLFVDRDGTEPFPARPVRCGAAYAPVAVAHPSGLSGTHWTLYERRP